MGNDNNNKNESIIWSDDFSSQYQGSLPSDFDEINDLFHRIWGNCGDIEFRQFMIDQKKVLIIWITSLIDKKLIQLGLMERFSRWQDTSLNSEAVHKLLSPTYETAENIQEINNSIGNGMAVVIIEGFRNGFVVDVMEFQERSIDKSDYEPSIIGPQAAFIESLDKNLGLVRRRLKSPRVKILGMELGVISKTKIAILYVHGIGKHEYVEEMQKRLTRIQIDGVLSTNHIAELIEDAPTSLFPTVQVTERPDRVAFALLEGRISVMVDGDPMAILAPVTLASLMNVSEDYSQRSIIASFLRLLRYFTFWCSLFMSSLFVAFLTFHQEMIPTILLHNILITREGVPFPPFVEILILEFSFEVLREAGVRLPRLIGQSVSIIGALVIGEAAVSAGLVSPLAVIVTALSGIASFSTPNYFLANTIRFLRFPFIVMAGFIGLYGIGIIFLMLLTHLVSLRSFGVPYMSPFAPFNRTEMKDTLIRAPWRKLNWRAKTFEPVDMKRGINQRPRPNPNQKENE